MAELLSPGVFVEEVASQVQVISGVSTSNFGIVGYTYSGPDNTPTLVTSFEQYTQKFGALVADSFLPLSVAAFFSNGGRRCYVVRVPPSDAVDADAKIISQTNDQAIHEGDGATVAFTDALPAPLSNLKVNSGASPIVPSSMTIRWREAAAPVATDDCVQRDGSTPLALTNGTLVYEGRLDPASLPAVDATFSVAGGFDEELPALLGGSLILRWEHSTGTSTTIALSTKVDRWTYTGVNGAGSAAVVDIRTGIFSVEIDAAEDPDTAFVMNADFTPADATKSCSDDGAGNLTGDLAAPGTVSYTAGTYSFTSSTAPLGPVGAGEGTPILVDYQIYAWDLDPVSSGEWANYMKVQLTGNSDYYDAYTGQFSRFDFLVLQYNSLTGNYDIKESYEELSLTNSIDAKYFPDVVNDLSDLLSVTEPGGDEPAGQLQAVLHSSILAGGDESAGGQTITRTLASAPVLPRSVVISYTDSTGVAREITDDGSGNLTGDIDVTGTNTIGYTSGAVDVKLGYPIDAQTLVSIVYYTSPEETVRDELFGDTTKGYTQGANGTFSSGTWGRNQFTNITLEPNKLGLYALNDVEELMQVGIPDFAGDETITGDIIDYVEGRALLPSGGDRFAIFTVPIASSPQEAVDWLRFTLGRNTKFGALYAPWLTVADPLADGRDLTVPPIGWIAGVYARTDAVKNVGKTPAGTIDGQLSFLTGLESIWTQTERDLVYQNKINPLVSSPQTGLAVWGGKTLALQSEWRNVNARRLFMFVERSVWNATHWIVFENNGNALWTKIKSQLNGFLVNLFNEGYFAGTNPSEAFRVICDGSNNSPESIAAGQVIIDVAIAPNVPAEFVRFRFTQKILNG